MTLPIHLEQRRAFLGLSLALISVTSTALNAKPKPQVQVWKTPSCGCCQAWVEHMQNEGFSVTSHNVEDTSPIRANAGIPTSMGSCHTALIGGLAIEGHVPAKEIRRLLAETATFRSTVVGLSVPAMPIGSPGMEQGSRRDPFNVILILKNNTSRIYQAYL